MKTLIKYYLENNPTSLYRDLPKVFGLSLNSLTEILYGKGYNWFENGLDLRVVDSKSNLFYFEKVESGFTYKYFMDRNVNGYLTSLKRFEIQDSVIPVFELTLGYDEDNRLISKRDSEGNNLIIVYDDSGQINCYMSDSLCKNVDKKMSWLKGIFSEEEEGRIELLTMRELGE